MFDPDYYYNDFVVIAPIVVFYESCLQFVDDKGNMG